MNLPGAFVWTLLLRNGTPTRTTKFSSSSSTFIRGVLAQRKGFSHGAREVCFPSGLHPPYMYFTAGTVRRSFTYGG